MYFLTLLYRFVVNVFFCIVIYDTNSTTFVIGKVALVSTIVCLDVIKAILIAFIEAFAIAIAIVIKYNVEVLVRSVHNLLCFNCLILFLNHNAKVSIYFFKCNF
nr:MAG TPA: hypothetical protein [Caudoviricetes sp.]